LIRSPSARTPAAGCPFSIFVTSYWPLAFPSPRISTHSSSSAITTLTSGPAMITTIRFHTGCA
jgi:hypothetical protein